MIVVINQFNTGSMHVISDKKKIEIFTGHFSTENLHQGQYIGKYTTEHVSPTTQLVTKEDKKLRRRRKTARCLESLWL